MFKQARSTFVALALALSFGSAFASVDVNTANADALRGIKDIGPAKAKSILDERQAHGLFKYASDLSTRVKSLGGKTVQRLDWRCTTENGCGDGHTSISATPASKPVVVKK